MGSNRLPERRPSLALPCQPSFLTDLTSRFAWPAQPGCRIALVMPETGESRRRERRWLLTYRYADMDTAGIAYEQARDIIVVRDVDVSVFRIVLNGVPHVVVVGEGSLTHSLRRRFAAACADGQPIELPDAVQQQLIERRQAGRIPGVFWERRTVRKPQRKEES